MTSSKRTNDNWLPSLLDDMFKTDWNGGTAINKTRVNMPAVNIKETDDDFKVDVAAPGKTKEDFNVELDNDVLTISSEMKEDSETKSETGKFTRKEFNYNSFKRAFGLPETVNSENISATYENGILMITIPKKEESKVQAKRMIDIS